MDSLMNVLGFYRVETKGNDMNYNDYTAAVEWLRIMQESGPAKAYGLGPSMAAYEVGHDKVLIYDAERDQTPASVEWLREVLGPEPDVDEVWLVNGRYVAWYGESMALFLGDIKLTTRGDVLTALRLFAKKEGA